MAWRNFRRFGLTPPSRRKPITPVAKVDSHASVIRSAPSLMLGVEGNALSSGTDVLACDSLSPGKVVVDAGVAYVPGGGDDSAIDMVCLVGWLDERFSDGGSLTTAECYRRWLASYFEAIGHIDADVIRNWIPPHSPKARLVEDEREALALDDKLRFASTDGLALSADVDALEEGVAGNSRYLAFIDRGSFGCLLEQLLGETRGGKLRYQSGAEAAMMTVRPNEWPSCRFLDSSCRGR